MPDSEDDTDVGVSARGQRLKTRARNHRKIERRSLGLLVRVRGGERGQRRAGRLDPQQRRERRQIDAEAARRVELRHQVDVGERRRVADQKRARGLARPAASSAASPRAMKWRHQRARRRPAQLVLAGAAAVDRFCSGWMPALTISASCRARARSQRIARAAAAAREALFEVLEDRHRLRDRRGAPPARRATSTGTCAIGLSARYAARVLLAAVAAIRFTAPPLVRRRPCRCSAMRTRQRRAGAPVVVELHPLTTLCSMRPKRLAPGRRRASRSRPCRPRLQERRHRLAARRWSRSRARSARQETPRARIGVRDGAAAQDRAGGEARACARCAR